MSGLFEKIYNEVICYEKDVTAMNKAVEQKNQELSLKYKNRLDEKEREELVTAWMTLPYQQERRDFIWGSAMHSEGCLHC